MNSLHASQVTSGADALTSTLQRARLSISGIRCAACVQLIEFRIAQLAGISSVKVNSNTQKADVSWFPEHTNLKNIISAIVALGYAAFPADQSLTQFQEKEKKTALWRLFVAGFAMMQIMMYAFPAYLVPVPEANGDLSPELDRLLKLASFIITIPVILFSAQPFFSGALRDLHHRHIGMDVPVALGILLTFLASIWGCVAGTAVYFDSVVMFVFLLLGARVIEANVKRKTSAALDVLTKIHTSYAQKVTNYPDRQHIEQVASDVIKVGEFLLVAAGEQVPCDGVVIEGESTCDEAFMTGESRPLAKTIGNQLIAGSINLRNVLIMRAEKVGSQTQLSLLIAMMESASAEKPRLVALADKHASRFLISILLIALISGVVWSFIDSSRALWIAISVIVVTCPCALSLATPGVMSAAIGLLAKHGTLVAKGRAIEGLAKTTHFVFDKTGTLTFGKLKLQEVVYLDKTLQKNTIEDLAEIAHLLASQSMHPVAKAIAQSYSEKFYFPIHSDERFRIDQLLEVPGLGIEGRVNGRKFRLGRLDFVNELGGAKFSIPSEFASKTVSVLGDEDAVLSFFVLADVLRDDAKLAIAELISTGKKVVLLSGDRFDVVNKVAAECGITLFQATLKPVEKYAKIAELQAQGAIVAMVGDGMNDGPALSIANVSIAMGQGAPISQTRSDCLLMSNRLSDFTFSVHVARKAFSLIRQNLMWSLLYNALAIPAAVLGYLEPWHAALGMSVSSLIVVLNGLRLLRLTPSSSLSTIPVSP
jgi:Cu2+-exporting ATPase